MTSCAPAPRCRRLAPAQRVLLSLFLVFLALPAFPVFAQTPTATPPGGYVEAPCVWYVIGEWFQFGGPWVEAMHGTDLWAEWDGDVVETHDFEGISLAPPWGLYCDLEPVYNLMGYWPENVWVETSAYYGAGNTGYYIVRPNYTSYPAGGWYQDADGWSASVVDPSGIRQIAWVPDDVDYFIDSLKVYVLASDWPTATSTPTATAPPSSTPAPATSTAWATPTFRAAWSTAVNDGLCSPSSSDWSSAWIGPVMSGEDGSIVVRVPASLVGPGRTIKTEVTSASDKSVYLSVSANVDPAWGVAYSSPIAGGVGRWLSHRNFVDALPDRVVEAGVVSIRLYQTYPTDGDFTGRIILLASSAASCPTAVPVVPTRTRVPYLTPTPYSIQQAATAVHVQIGYKPTQCLLISLPDLSTLVPGQPTPVPVGACLQPVEFSSDIPVVQQSISLALNFGVAGLVFALIGGFLALRR